MKSERVSDISREKHSSGHRDKSDHQHKSSRNKSFREERSERHYDKKPSEHQKSTSRIKVQSSYRQEFE